MAKTKDISHLPIFSASAQCPECKSFDTIIAASRPANRTRYHLCKRAKCGHRFVTRMGETVEPETEAPVVPETEEQEVCRLVAESSVREFPWLVKTRENKPVETESMQQVGHPFRYWTESAQKPVTAAVFRCKACSGHSFAIVGNVLRELTACGCQRVKHGLHLSPAYKPWRHMLTRQRQNELVEYSWLHPVTGCQAMIEDLGEMPSDEHYLCRRVGAMGWIRGNVYWRRSTPGVWSSTADDSWLLVSGSLIQVGATMRLCGKPAVFHCSKCNRNVVESRAGVIKHKHDRCQACREQEQKIEYRGQSRTVPEWAQVTGIPAATLHDRLRYGWEVERMLTTPPKAYRGRQTASSVQRVEAMAGAST